MKGVFSPVRKRGIGNLVLDILFVLWVVYFLTSGRIVPNVLIWDDLPNRQAIVTHQTEPVSPAQVQPANKDQGEPGLPAVPEGEDGST